MVFPAHTFPVSQAFLRDCIFLILRVGFEGNVLNIDSRVLILLMQSARMLPSAAAICSGLFYKGKLISSETLFLSVFATIELTKE